MMPPDLSFLILAGGKSSRMGTNKADLHFHGQTFLATLIEKARAMGFTDILVSGYPHEILSITPIMDEIPGRGPLGGMYSCFKAAKNAYCFVICVDVPQIIGEIVNQLIDFHFKGQNQITLLSQNGKIEPLIGIYPTDSYKKIAPIIKDSSAKVFRLIDQYDYKVFHVDQSYPVMSNINTPADYQQIVGNAQPEAPVENKNQKPDPPGIK